MALLDAPDRRIHLLLWHPSRPLLLALSDDHQHTPYTAALATRVAEKEAAEEEASSHQSGVGAAIGGSSSGASSSSSSAAKEGVGKWGSYSGKWVKKQSLYYGSSVLSDSSTLFLLEPKRHTNFAGPMYPPGFQVRIGRVIFACLLM